MGRSSDLCIRKNPDKGPIDNFRPITLLDVELKILAKVLSKKLALAAGDVNGVTQTCSIPGRTNQDNI